MQPMKPKGEKLPAVRSPARPQPHDHRRRHFCYTLDHEGSRFREGLSGSASEPPPAAAASPDGGRRQRLNMRGSSSLPDLPSLRRRTGRLCSDGPGEEPPWSLPSRLPPVGERPPWVNPR